MEDELKKKLLNKFFYIHWRNDTNDNKNIFNKKNNIENFEDINILNNKINNSKRQLSALKIKALRSMIINQEKIPQNWIQKNNYKIILDKAIKSPNFVDYAKNYIVHNSINKKKEDFQIVNKIREPKKLQFLTIIKENSQSKNKNKGISTMLRNNYGYNKNNKLLGKSLNRILSYQGLNTESSKIKDNKYVINNTNLKNIQTEFNILKKSVYKKEIIDNYYFKDKSLKKNLKSIYNIYSGLKNKLTLPKIM